MRTWMFITLLCGMMLMFTTTVFAQDDGEATPEPDAEATSEPANAVQGIIIIGADAEDTPEATAEAETDGETDLATDTENQVTDTEEAVEDEEETALGADLLILLVGLGGVFAVGMVMIGRSNFDNDSTATS